MEGKFKKIVARELLVLFSTSIIAILSFFGTFLYDEICMYSYRSAEKNIADLSKELEEVKAKVSQRDYKYNNQKWLYNQWNEKFDVGEFNDKFWDNARHVTIKNGLWTSWNSNRWSLEFITFLKSKDWTPEKLDDFIEGSTVTPQEKEFENKAYELEKKLTDEYLKSKHYWFSTLAMKERLSFAKDASLWYLAVAFVLRWIVYAAIWSIRTIKS